MEAIAFSRVMMGVVATGALDGTLRLYDLGKATKRYTFRTRIHRPSNQVSKRTNHCAGTGMERALCQHGDEGVTTAAWSTSVPMVSTPFPWDESRTYCFVCESEISRLPSISRLPPAETEVRSRFGMEWMALSSSLLGVTSRLKVLP